MKKWKTGEIKGVRKARKFRRESETKVLKRLRNQARILIAKDLSAFMSI